MRGEGSQAAFGGIKAAWAELQLGPGQAQAPAQTPPGCPPPSGPPARPKFSFRAMPERKTESGRVGALNKIAPAPLRP